MKSEDVDYWIFFTMIAVAMFMFALTSFLNYNSSSLILKTQVNQGNDIKIIVDFNNKLKRSKTQTYNLKSDLEQVIFEKTFNYSGGIEGTKNIIKKIVGNEIIKEKYELSNKLEVESIKILPGEPDTK